MFVVVLKELKDAVELLDLQNLLFQLLQFNPVERLGAGVAGVEDIKSHPFFTPVDWAELTR